MQYNTAFPYFPQEEVEKILDDFRDILEGREMLSMGKNVALFEERFADYLGACYSAVTNSCTSALEVALESINISSNDEVIVPVQTFFASASAIVKTGAKPVFCNIDKQFTIDFNDLKARITERTKAVIIVHFAGLIHSDMLEISEYLKARNIFLIEDCAHAHGAKLQGKFAGTFGDISCFSFFATKIMTMGEGGAVVTNNSALFKKLKSHRNRGLDVDAPIESFVNFGSNYRMTEMQAILGLTQLKHIEDFVEKRNKIAQKYSSKLRHLCDDGVLRVQESFPYDSKNRHAHWRFVVFLEGNEDPEIERQKIKKYMNEKSIVIDWAYTPLVHQQPAFYNLLGKLTGLEFSENLAKTHFCLPIHTQLLDEEAEFIAESISDYFRKGL